VQGARGVEIKIIKKVRELVGKKKYPQLLPRRWNQKKWAGGF